MQPELMSFAFKLTANQDSANDLVQDSILKALDNTQKFIRQETFFAESLEDRPAGGNPDAGQR